MKTFQNNAFFWQKVDTLCLSGDYIETAKAGDSHPKHPSFIFPCSYGYIKYLDTEDNPNFNVFRGSLESKVDALIICGDILNRSIDIKVLIGCNEEEEKAILHFLNQSDFQKTVIIRRGDDIPSWGYSDYA